MPQKRNPCPLELIRAKSATVQSMLFQVLEIIRSLPSGYNRDFQETKRPIMQGLETTRLSLTVFSIIIGELHVSSKACIEAFSSELFATDLVLKLTSRGTPFRDAYKMVAKDLETVSNTDPVENILSKMHQGATGNLGLESLKSNIDKEQEWINGESKNSQAIQTQLLNPR